MSRTQFRALLFFDLLLLVAVLVVRFATEESLAPNLHELWTRLYPRMTQSTVAYILIYDGAVAAIGIVAVVGLCFFKRWGRPLFLGYLFIKLFYIPLTAPFIDSGATVFVFYLGGLTEGCIASLLFFSSTKEAFVRRAES